VGGPASVDPEIARGVHEADPEMSDARAIEQLSPRSERVFGVYSPFSQSQTTVFFRSIRVEMSGEPMSVRAPARPVLLAGWGRLGNCDEWDRVRGMCRRTPSGVSIGR